MDEEQQEDWIILTDKGSAINLKLEITCSAAKIAREGSPIVWDFNLQGCDRSLIDLYDTSIQQVDYGYVIIASN